MLLARADSGNEALECVSVDAWTVVQRSFGNRVKDWRAFTALTLVTSWPHEPVPIQADATHYAEPC